MIHVILGIVFSIVFVGRLSGQDFTQWVDITDQLGLQPPQRLPLSGQYYLTEKYRGRPVPFDFDNDGDLDLLLTYGPHVADSLHKGLNKLFRNEGGMWNDVSEEMGISSLPPAAHAAVGDIDGDGYLDLYLCMFGSDRLMKNVSGLYWEDITDSSGIRNNYWATDAIFLDANGDGRLDIYVANYIDYSISSQITCSDPVTRLPFYCDPEIYDPAPNRLFVNRGSGRFEDMTETFGLADTSSRSLAAVPFDANNDGRLDIFILSYRSPNRLYIAENDSSFIESGLLAGVAFDPDGKESSWNDVVIMDVNGDDFPDLFLTQTHGQIHVLLNDDAGQFFDGYYQTGLFKPRTLFRATAAHAYDVNYNGRDDLLLADDDRFILSDSLKHFRQMSQFVSTLLLDDQYHFVLPVARFSMVLDTFLLVEPLPEGIDPDGREEYFTVGPLQQPLFSPPSVSEGAPGMLLLPGAGVPSAEISPDSIASGARVIEIHGETVVLDTLRIRENPVDFTVADMDRDGIQEVLASYPSGMVRIWKPIDDLSIKFIGLQLQVADSVSTMIGSRVKITTSAGSYHYLETDNIPNVIYVPEKVRDVLVDVTWPDGQANSYRTRTLNRHYTLTKPEAIP